MLAKGINSVSLRRFASAAAAVKKDTFQAKDIETHLTSRKKEKPSIEGQFGFGNVYTDHMLSIDWNDQKGWGNPQIIPHGPISIATSATSLHYGISCYEAISVVKNK
jgi:branched-chain amino acid aminotransferase